VNHPFNRIGKSAFVLILTIASAAQAAILADGSPGAAAPPVTLGPYDMTAFGPDSQPFVTEVDGVAGPKGGELIGIRFSSVAGGRPTSPPRNTDSLS
jgi:hypothetical protein